MSIWIPDGWRTKLGRVLVLGESGYGDDGDLNGSHRWIPAYIARRVEDRTYNRVVKALNQSRGDFWHGVAFMNFVEKAGAKAKDRPTRTQYRDAGPRLVERLRELQPFVVWI